MYVNIISLYFLIIYKFYIFVSQLNITFQIYYTFIINLNLIILYYSFPHCKTLLHKIHIHDMINNTMEINKLLIITIFT